MCGGCCYCLVCCNSSTLTLQMGTLQVSNSPLPADFELPAVLHGHAVCTDLQLNPNADESTRKWCVGGEDGNVFVSKEGVDLCHFAAAVAYENNTGNSVFVFCQVLTPVAETKENTSSRNTRRSASNSSSSRTGNDNPTKSNQSARASANGIAPDSPGRFNKRQKPNSTINATTSSELVNGNGRRSKRTKGQAIRAGFVSDF